MTFNTTRLFNICFQEVDVLTIFKIMAKAWRGVTMCGRIQNLKWTQLECTLKIMMVPVGNATFGYDFISEIWIPEGSGPLAGGCLAF